MMPWALIVLLMSITTSTNASPTHHDHMRRSGLNESSPTVYVGAQQHRSSKRSVELPSSSACLGFTHLAALFVWEVVEEDLWLVGFFIAVGAIAGTVLGGFLLGGLGVLLAIGLSAIGIMAPAWAWLGLAFATGVIGAGIGLATGVPLGASVGLAVSIDPGELRPQF